MKRNNLNRMGLQLLPLCFFFLLGLIACQDDEATQFKTDLALNSTIVRVPEKAGTTRILVYSDKDWSVRFLDPEVAWASVAVPTGSGNGEFLVDFESNENQLPRSTKILIHNNAKADTVDLQQKGITPVIAITDTDIMGIAGGGRMKSGIACNIPFELIQTTITYPAGSGNSWITEVNIQDGSLKFRLERSTETVVREGLLSLRYTDAFGIVVEDSIRIKQSPGFDNESGDAVLKTFEYLKSLPAGVITENIYLEAVVVSDKGNPNLATNQNKSRTEIDPIENQITVYIQNEQGTSGIMLKAKAPGDNIFDRYDRIKLWLKNLQIVKEANPERYTLKGIETVHILEKNEGDIVMPKEMYMKNLTDNDLYTFIKLKDVEIAVPSGCFSNINEGYNKRTSVYPTCIRDIDGNSMYMLTNVDVPYRRDGAQVPQGSGSISGIIVYDYLLRYGGDIGRYAIRQLTREEIALSENRVDGFSQVLAEWSRYKKGEADPIAPDAGAERGAKLSHSKSTVGSGPDFNGLTLTTATVTDGGFAASNWWNNNQGESWIIQFSTTGISKSLSIQIEGDVILGAPRNYVIEWSTSLESGPWQTVGEYTMQDLVQAGANTLYTQVPGHKVVNFNLPDVLLDQSMVYIRLRAKNNQAGTASSDVGGVVDNTKASRLGHLSIKYNK